MALPRLTIKLFPARQGGNDLERSGSLAIPLADVQALCEWLLGQPGEHDDYLNTAVVKLAAFQYSNRSRSGSTYLTVQLREPRPSYGADGRGTPQAARAARAATGWDGNAATWAGHGSDDEEIPF